MLRLIVHIILYYFIYWYIYIYKNVYIKLLINRIVLGSMESGLSYYILYHDLDFTFGNTRDNSVPYYYWFGWLCKKWLMHSFMYILQYKLVAMFIEIHNQTSNINIFHLIVMPLLFESELYQCMLWNRFYTYLAA